MNNELYHYGVKGMKWGVRRYQASRVDNNVNGASKRDIRKRRKDTTKLAKTTLRYYNSANALNALNDAGKDISKINSRVTRNYKKTDQLVNKLKKKYAHIDVHADLEDNGYIIKGMSVTLAALDKYGNLSSAHSIYAIPDRYDELRNS